MEKMQSAPFIIPSLLENQQEINQHLFLKYKENNIILNNSFKDDTWIMFQCFTKKRVFMHFNIDNVFVNDNQFLINSFKSWLLYLLEKNYNPITAKRKVQYVVELINYTNGFNKDMIESFSNYSSKFSIKTWKQKLTNLKEFFNFFNLEIDEEYYNIINSFLSRNEVYKNKDIPKSDDVLKFNLIIEDFFENKASTKDFIKFFPILFWWKFTNIIPIRISEFCYIRKDAFNVVDGTLTIPRSKKQFDDELTYEEIFISKKLSIIIENYLNLTSDFTQRETLISYDAYRQSNNQLKPVAEFNDSFYYGLFSNLLAKFYREIVFKMYNYTLNIENHTLMYANHSKSINKIINPNDTRYFAFINLMLQGYHPVEIANIGGHTTLHSQIGYYNHIEHWIDSDIMNLYYLNQGLYNEMEIYFKKQLEIEKKVVPKTLIGKAYIPLEIGYCTDPYQNCEVDNHFICPYWRITNDEYVKHEDEILSNIANTEQNITAVFKNLIELHKSSILNAKDERLDEKNINHNYKLRNNARAIKDALHKLCVLRSNLQNG